MSKHTDTGRAGKKLWILIPVIAVLIIAAALVWLNSVYIYAGGLHRRDSAQIDVRGKSISEERYLRLREQLPDCKIYWDVPIGGAVIDCESTAIVLTSLTEEDVARLAFFPALAELDLTAADVSPERFDAVRAAYPALSVRWSIPIGASRYPSDAESITLTDFTVSELPLFDYFTALRSADARGCACYDALLALREKYPALKLEWQVPLARSILTAPRRSPWTISPSHRTRCARRCGIFRRRRPCRSPRARGARQKRARCAPSFPPLRSSGPWRSSAILTRAIPRS